MFTFKIFDRIKEEKTFQAFIYSQIDDRFLENFHKKKADKQSRIDESLHSISLIDESEIKQDSKRLVLLRSKFSKIELIMELLNLTQSKILNSGFLKCFASLHDPTNAFVGQKTNPV